MKKALLIVDVQNDYFPGGRSELHNPLGALENIEKILKQFREKQLPVIHVRHVSLGENASFFLPDTDGARIHERVTPEDGEYLVVKHAPNSFLRTNLSDILQENGITDLTVCGMMSHMCIDATVRACMDFGIKVTLPEDACATKALAFKGKTLPAETIHDVFMASLNGVFASVIRTNELNV